MTFQPIRTLKIDALTVQIYASPAAVASAASDYAHTVLATALAQQPEAGVIFATGRSQKQCLHHFTSAPTRTREWSKITGFHLDEYLGVAASHPASFRQYLHTHLTSRVTLKQFYEIEGDGLLPITICEDYERALRSHPLDLCFLGIGNNGHLAFNDPDVADFYDPKWVKLVRLDHTNRQQQASSTAFTHLEAVPQYAFTLTLSAISAVRHPLCLAFGEAKASIVNALLSGPISSHCPASILRQCPKSLIMLDTAAASQLTS